MFRFELKNKQVNIKQRYFILKEEKDNKTQHPSETKTAGYSFIRGLLHGKGPSTSQVTVSVTSVSRAESQNSRDTLTL